MYRDPSDRNSKAIGACSMSHLDLLKNGLRGELPEKNENGFVVSDDCRDYAIKQAAPFIKEHGPHLNKWDKSTVSNFINFLQCM
jgi:hypothetical protein